MNKLLDRVPGRAIAVVLALILAAISVVALQSATNSTKATNVEQLGLVTALQITRDLPAGAEAADLFIQGTVREVSATRDSLPLEAISDLTTVTGFLVSDLRAGQILHARMFTQTRPAANAFAVPAGQVAVSIDVDVTAGVANFLDVGDSIGIMATVGGAREGTEDAATGEAATRFLLQNVKILAIGRRVTNAPDGGTQEVVVRDDGLLTLTLAVDAIDAERLVYASANGGIHIALLPDDVGDFTPTTTPGRNAGNLFDR